MEEFWSTLLHCGLIDLDFTDIFTWRNGKGNGLVQERLDRACATIEWRDIFPHTKVHHFQAAYFDHVLILITT